MRMNPGESLRRFYFSSLVVLGLLISIPIVIWGSQLILKYVERFPAIIYFGAGVLAWTAAKMMLGEPLLKETLQSNALIAPLTYVAVIGAVIWYGFRGNHRRLENSIAEKLAALPAVQKADSSTAVAETGGKTMKIGRAHV